MVCLRLLNSGRSLHCVIALAGLAIVGLAPLSAFAATEQVTMTYSFDRPQISQVTIDGQQYHRVTMPGCASGGIAGQPALPTRGARILLPMGTQVSNIAIVSGDKVLLGGDYYVEPVGEQVRLTAPPSEVIPPTPDPAIYAADSPFPATLFAQIGTQCFRGYRILILKLQPVQYVPTSGELYYYPDLTVVVDTVAADTPALFRGLPRDARQVLAKIDNPELADTYVVGAERGRGGYDLLILTTPALAGTFQPLEAYHDTHGLATEIHTTDDVGSNQPGPVRDYIIDRYYNDGIEYVIIGGDDDVIPARDLYVDGINDMPGDIYFSCLDGSWNYDGDGHWGEPTDGEGGSDVDMYAEVFVGRACAGNTTEAARFVNKTIWYLNGQHSCTENVLLVGEYLGFGGVAEWGGNYLDELNGGSSEHGYTTVGFDPEIFNIDTLYERDGSWTKSDLTNLINNVGVHVLDHLGHGSPDYAMKLYNSDILSDLTNEDLIFVYSQTCLAGHLDGADCWAEHMHIKIDEGAFAVIMNARYGYGQFNSTDGASQRFNREFWDAIFSEQMGELGRANADSKEDNVWRVNDDYMRWCLYEINLFGDPTMPIQGVNGFRIDPDPALHELCVPADDEAVYTIEIDQLGDFVEVITLTADGVPAGANVDFSANSLPPPFTTVMTVSNLAGAAADEYNVTITGTSATLQRAAMVGLNIADGVPEPVTLSSPGDGETGVPLLAELSWQPAAQARDYELEVATDSAFTNVVYSVTTAETSHTLDMALDSLTRYYWHVRATNICGEGDYSDAFDFITVNMIRPISYDLLNGETGTYTYFDDDYDGDGNNTVPLAPLSNGLGDLTNGVIATENWDSTSEPYVGWVSVDPTITFHFAGEVNIDRVVLHVDDSNYGGVAPPQDVTISMGGVTLDFAVVDPPGVEPFALVFEDLGMKGETMEVTIADHTSYSSYMMLSEVEFYSDEQPCFGDLDGDNDIDLADLSQLLAHYGMTGMTYEDGDLDADGDVDLSDLSALLSVYGTTCP